MPASIQAEVPRMISGAGAIPPDYCDRPPYVMGPGTCVDPGECVAPKVSDVIDRPRHLPACHCVMHPVDCSISSPSAICVMDKEYHQFHVPKGTESIRTMAIDAEHPHLAASETGKGHRTNLIIRRKYKIPRQLLSVLLAPVFVASLAKRSERGAGSSLRAFQPITVRPRFSLHLPSWPEVVKRTAQFVFTLPHGGQHPIPPLPFCSKQYLAGSWHRARELESFS